MIFTQFPISVDYENAHFPLPVAAPVNPKKDDFQPTLSCYIHDELVNQKGDALPRKAVIVVPGGGYGMVSEREAEPIALEYFNAGYQAFIVRYSVKPNVFPAALMELATAMKTVRTRAAEFHVNPDKIVVAGFSAGGHLTASLGTMYGEEFLHESVHATTEELKPNGLILIYPVIDLGEFRHDGSYQRLCDGLPELQEYLSLQNRVTDQTPPTFLASTWTDQLVPIQNALLFASALAAHHVSAEVHIYKEGRHGLALADNRTRTDLAPEEIAVSEYPLAIRHVSEWMGQSITWMKLL